MKTNSRHGKAAFTLIELMAVITIIVILAGLVVAGLGYVQEKQARSKAQVQIALLSKAIEEYKLDMGDYPGTANTALSGDVSAQLYQSLFFEGYQAANGVVDSTGKKATTIYLPDLDPRTTKQGWVNPSTSSTPQANLKITDPWGNDYLYRKGTNAMNPDFDLWSKGKDGRTNADPKNKDSLDDIRNF